MLDMSLAAWTVNPLALVLSMLVTVAIALGVLRLVFSIGKWKKKMGILPGVNILRRRVSAKFY
jgi:hypothetical protein